MNKWACKDCTFLNKCEAIRCEMCLHEKDGELAISTFF